MNSHRWWLRLGDRYAYLATAVLFLVAASIYYWSGDSLAQGLARPWQAVLWFELAYVGFYWVADALEKNQVNSWLRRFVEDRSLPWHTLAAFAAVLAFSILYDLYLPAG